jgi:PhzF family phenazine biosynthesis protein
MKLSLIDAFTDVPFAGNPAGVCLLENDASTPWRRRVARELGCSDTAFLRPSGDGVFALRWFTPAAEVDLCGHATLASAHFLWEGGLADASAPIRFETKSGSLFARRSGREIELDFPAEPAREIPAPAGLLDALGIRAQWVGRNRLDYVVLVEKEEELRALRPDFSAVRTACGTFRGVIVTSVSTDPQVDFISRYFAPALGIDEDPVTGSAHCCLGPFWAERLRKDVACVQASSQEGG